MKSLFTLLAIWALVAVVIYTGFALYYWTPAWPPLAGFHGFFSFVLITLGAWGGILADLLDKSR